MAPALFILYVIDIGFAFYVLYTFHELRKQIDFVKSQNDLLWGQKRLTDERVSTNYSLFDVRYDRIIERLVTLEQKQAQAELPIIEYRRTGDHTASGDPKIAIRASFETIRDIHMKLFEKHINSTILNGQLTLFESQLEQIKDQYVFELKTPNQ